MIDTASSETAAERRVYSLPPRDRSGFLLGLGLGQILVVAVGAGISVVLFQSGTALLVALLPLGIAMALDFATVGGQPILDYAPAVGRAARIVGRRRRRWLAPIPLAALCSEPNPDTHDVGGEVIASPTCLGGVELVAGQGDHGDRPRMGMIRDATQQTLTALVRVPGDEFALLGRGEQEARLEGWASVLGGFATDANPVVRVCWTDIAVPAGLGDHLEWVDEQAGTSNSSDNEPAEFYRELVAAVGPITTTHDVVCAITVARDRIRGGRQDLDRRWVDALDRAVSSLDRALRSAGLEPSAPLTQTEIARLVRASVDPSAARSVSPQTGRLSDRLGLTRPSRAGPMATEWSWGTWRTDAAIHRSYWIEEWPRMAVAPDWMIRLLSAPVPRTVTVIFEPESLLGSQRRLERELTKLDSDAEARQEKGRRVTAVAQRSRDAVTEREHELVSGYVEYGYCGLITVSAPDPDALAGHCAELEDAARSVGVQLRALDGRHDLAWAATTPLGLGLARLGGLR